MSTQHRKISKKIREIYNVLHTLERTSFDEYHRGVFNGLSLGLKFFSGKGPEIIKKGEKYDSRNEILNELKTIRFYKNSSAEGVVYKDLAKLKKLIYKTRNLGELQHVEKFYYMESSKRP